MDAIQEKAREVGRLLAQTTEYQALKRANDRLEEDRGAAPLLGRLATLQDEFARALRRGVEPPEAQQTEYEQLLDQVQTMSVYQGVVAAQANFDRLTMRINEEIARGIEAGEQSRIVLPS